MSSNDDKTADDATQDRVESLMATPDLASALESEQFRLFLDQIPIAIIVSEAKKSERIVYANPEFERLSGQLLSEIVGKSWSVIRGQSEGEGTDAETKLGTAIVELRDRVGTFRIERSEGEPAIVDAYSNLIEDDAGVPAFRLAALVDVGAHGHEERRDLEQRIREKDTLLLEFQHRVKNNLQMITALIRIEARNAEGRIGTSPFDRLAGRIDSIQLIYKMLSDHGKGDEVDLGVYLGDIVSSVMHAHAVEGIRLDLKVDSYTVSVNVALPTGLVVNELLTNSLKYAFVGRTGGTITLHSLVDPNGCRVVIADDGVGLPAGIEWPKRGKLGALIVRSLRENAKADIRVDSSPGMGMRVTIVYTRKASAPEEAASP
jgi:PAS domain S-box-containing protein